MANIITVKRIVYYYELSLTYTDGNDLKTFFNRISKLSVDKESDRYQKFGSRTLFIQGVDIDGDIVYGKLRSIRTDLFPELINMTTDEVKDVEADTDDGIMETSHFIIKKANNKVYLAIEYNHFGAKIEDIVAYLKKVGYKLRITKNIGYVAYLNNVQNLIERINRVSEFTMKIHKNFVPELEAVDGQLYESARIITQSFENEYAALDFKIDYRTFTDTPLIKKTILGLYKWFEENPDKKILFNYVNFTAEDKEKNKLLQTFDLLADKLKSTINVQKKPSGRIVVSADMFPKMLFEMNKKNLL